MAGNLNQPSNWREHTLKYDYLVIGLGSEDNFFGMSDIEKNAFTMKTINDAIILRRHTIKILEQANLEQDNHDLKKFVDFCSCCCRRLIRHFQIRSKHRYLSSTISSLLIQQIVC